ncbi:hypothetical protein ADUPG1_003766, partial [Aduncisulcus paluster]
ITCASDSYSTYTDADTFTCTRPSASGTDCLGGCEYVQECKYSSDATAECTDVIPDDSLNECIFNLFSDETHCTSDGLFSVASLKTLDTSEDSSYVLSCSSKTPSVTDITGLEHAGFITKIDLSDNDLSDVSLMFSLSNIESLDLSGNGNLASIPSLSLLTSLSVFNVSDTNISSSTGLSADPLPTSITELYASNTAIDNDTFTNHIATRMSNLQKLYLDGTLVNNIAGFSS